MVVEGLSREALSSGHPPAPHSYLYLSVELFPFLDNVTVLAHRGCPVTVPLYQGQRSKAKQHMKLACHQCYNLGCLIPPPGHFPMAGLANVSASFFEIGSWPAAPSRAKPWPLQAGCSTANSTEACGIFLPKWPHLLEPRGRHWPGTAQHPGLSKYILPIHSSKSAGQVLICPLSREVEQSSDAPTSQVEQGGLFSFLLLMTGVFVTCSRLKRIHTIFQ